MVDGSVFVTGGTGFAGRPVIAELLRSGRTVTALVRADERIDGCRTVRGELATLDRLASEIGKAQAIVHLASPRSLDEDVTYRDDVQGTGKLIAAWRTGPFVYASTTTVHGIPKSVIRPDTPVDPLLWYDVGKIVNERQVRHASGEDGRGPGISLRPTFFIGASPRARDRQLFTEIYDACRSGRTFVFETEQSLETSGCAFIGLEDFSRAVVAALGMSMSGEFPLAGGFTRWRDLIDLINERAHGTGRYIVRKDGAKGDEVRLAHSRTELDSSAFEAATGWRPRESIDHLVDAFVRDDR